ncbi:hypothetical protein L873DRAFT_1795584 [Choiromyces venosus 120613-1]|uniref:Uncharacterized protein n=1 Tax=Choiromyces venosus 120613-1 TaxID=1336337 RepID=A0A3N4IZQ9_9PEZI|nr:hypothetical protein L873DRAFT_1795584 [Choiromyces venosus 120613-1]
MASAFLHLILGATIIHLDMPATQLLIHGLPTSHSLTTIATKFTTFNSGLALTQQPRWLTSDESRASKSASSIVITITGPKAPLFVATSAPAPLPAAGVPSHIPLGITPAPLQPAIFEAAPAATSLQGVLTAMAHTSLTFPPALLDLNAMIHLTRRNLRR